MSYMTVFRVAIGSGVTTVSCACGLPFCFRCGQEAHDPATCDMLSAWKEKCQSESETANWILANTKKCPKCNCRIEKNQGCNHMSCKMCRFEFCWICMGDWSEHGQNTGGYYKCNKYDPAAASSDSTVERAKAELDRYLHYYQRYHGHDSSLKFASKQRQEAEVRMAILQEAEKSAWIDVQFIKQAVEQVHKNTLIINQSQTPFVCRANHSIQDCANVCDGLGNRVQARVKIHLCSGSLPCGWNR